jgi:hypothetical protein
VSPSVSWKTPAAAPRLSVKGELEDNPRNDMTWISGGTKNEIQRLRKESRICGNHIEAAVSIGWSWT